MPLPSLTTPIAPPVPETADPEVLAITSATVNVPPAFVVSKPHDDVDRIPPVATSPDRFVISVVTSAVVSPSAPPTPSPSVAAEPVVVLMRAFVQLAELPL